MAKDKDQTTESSFDFDLEDKDRAQLEAEKLRPEFAHLAPLVIKSFMLRLLEMRKVDEIHAYDMEGKLRILKVDCVMEGDGGPESKMVLGKIPGGKARFLGALSFIEHSSETPFSLGWAAHRTAFQQLVPENPIGFDTEINGDERKISVGKNFPAQTQLFETQQGLEIIATFPQGIKDKTTLTGYLIYVQS